MRLKKTVIIFLLLACSCSVFKKRDQLSKEQSSDFAEQKYLVFAPIVKFNVFGCPCINVQIEGKNHLLKLDLGFRGDMAIREGAMNGLSSKTYLREHTTYGIRGKAYKKRLYEIPKLKIGSKDFSPTIMHEESEEFLKDAQFNENEKSPSIRVEEGRLGCALFSNTILLIDIPTSQIAICDSIDTLSNSGYLIESFVKTPLFLQNGLPEVEVNTPDGPLRCILDTGTTWNVLDAELSDEKEIWEPENAVEYPYFKISGVDMGRTSFHRMPIRLPIRVEAILGMEFFKTHLVFFDFSNKAAYFLKTPPDNH